MRQLPLVILAMGLATGLAAASRAVAQDSAGPPPSSASKSAAVDDSVSDEYAVQPGDVLTITVWKEQDLTGDVLVRPDGGLSFPLVGDLSASGKTVSALRKEVVTRLQRYLPNPVVTVAVKQIGGNAIYVVGKVQRPGEYPFGRAVDVMQALSLAGGATPFAALNSIVILRRENGRQQAIHFRYSQVAHGKDLSIFYVLSTWNPYVVVLMQSHFQIAGL